MEQSDKEKLRKNLVALVSDLDAARVAVHLQANGTLTEQMAEEVMVRSIGEMQTKRRSIGEGVMLARLIVLWE